MAFKDSKSVQKLPHSLKKSVCVSCGGDLNKHNRIWLSNTCFIILTTVSLTFLPNSIAGVLRRFREYVASKLVIYLRKKRIVTISSEREALRIPRARALFDAAKERGITMRSYALRGRSFDFYDAHLPDGRSISFFGLPRPIERRHNGERWMDDKYVLKQRLSSASIPVPRGGQYSNFSRMWRDFKYLTKPVVLKPRRGSRGNHTTTYIYSDDELLRAYKLAKQLCHFIVMEEHLSGSVYRATVIDGKVVGILAGEPPRITGDGKQSIADLIDIKNAGRSALVAEVRVTYTLIRLLLRNGFTLKSIPPVGETIDLSDKIGYRHGGVSSECTTYAHPALVRALEDAARVVDDPIIGFDFIIQDAAKDPKNQRWGILEANSLPFIELHNEPRIGTSNNVAKYVWDLWGQNTV